MENKKESIFKSEVLVLDPKNDKRLKKYLKTLEGTDAENLRKLGKLLHHAMKREGEYCPDETVE